MNKPNKIIIHHSDSKDHGTLKNFDEIKKWHVKENGWRDIGYHYVIEKIDGVYTILKGRPEIEDGAHCYGQNEESIGICVVGNFEVDQVPEEAYIKLAELIKDIRRRHGELPIHGHKEFYNTSCPGKNFNLQKVKELLKPDPLVEAFTYVDKNISDINLDYWISMIPEIRKIQYLPELLLKIIRSWKG